jgi:hypothetical protein
MDKLLIPDMNKNRPTVEAIEKGTYTQYEVYWEVPGLGKNKMLA